MDFNLTIEQQQIRDEIKKVCREFPDAYWRKIDSEKAYPDAFVKKLGDLGWLAALIPEEFGGTGLGITEASIILEEINHSGGVATASERAGNFPHFGLVHLGKNKAVRHSARSTPVRGDNPHTYDPVSKFANWLAEGNLQRETSQKVTFGVPPKVP